MVFHYYTDMMSKASKSIASWVLIAGLLLIGFGVVILTFPEVFAFLAAAIFFLAGIGACGTAIRIYLAQRRIDKACSDDDLRGYRKNVRIHTEEHYDI